MAEFVSATSTNNFTACLAPVQYLNRALAHHMQHALNLDQLPLTDDAEAQRWCGHEQKLVQAAALHAVRHGPEVVLDVAWKRTSTGQMFLYLCYLAAGTGLRCIEAEWYPGWCMYDS